MDSLIFSFILNGLLGIAMFFLKLSNDANKERLAKMEGQIDHIRDNYFKKEDFREFKDELFTRLDKMEISFNKKIEERSK